MIDDVSAKGYKGRDRIKGPNVVIEWTPDRILEYDRCATDPVYFITKYCKVIHIDRGLVPLELYPYQERMINHFQDNRFSVVLSSRQSGKSIVSCAYILWFALFNSEKTIAILANKGSTAREMLSRITLMLENIPLWLQPGAKSVNKGKLEFDNNSSIIAAATSGSSIRGLSISLLFLDEFAFVEDAETFYTSTYPVISSGQSSRVIVTSTANGVGNPFHQIWEGATTGTNEYAPFRVDWWDVPGRDEKWKEQTIRNTSERQFEQEFGNSFMNTGSTLIDANVLLGLKAKTPIWSKDNICVYKESTPNHQYVMVVDVAKGRGADFSTFSIIDISTNPFEQVVTYRNSLISPLLFPTVIERWAKVYNNALVIIENNDQGAVVCNGLYHDIEYENVFTTSSSGANAVGLYMDKKVKRIGCSNLKDLIEEYRLTVNDKETIRELCVFSQRGASYAATDGNHDDLVMGLVAFGWFTTGSLLFQEMTNVEVRDLLYQQRMAEIEDELLPFGLVDDGHDEPNQWLM